MTTMTPGRSTPRDLAAILEWVDGCPDRPNMRLLVTGSRAFTDATLVVDILSGIWLMTGNLTIVHGACPCQRCREAKCRCKNTSPISADAIADRWGRNMGKPHVTVEPHPAEWARYGKQAGMIRNAEMVKLGATMCLGFLKLGAENRGTRNCMARAVASGIHVEGVWGD